MWLGVTGGQTLTTPGRDRQGIDTLVGSKQPNIISKANNYIISDGVNSTMKSTNTVKGMGIHFTRDVLTSPPPMPATTQWIQHWVVVS